jgi:hypothetical protein
MTTQTMFVDKFYVMDPEFDDLLNTGAELKDGMIVLIEESMSKTNLEFLNVVDSASYQYDYNRALENNRWCTVSQVSIRRRYDYDQYGAVIGESSPLISFIAIYADGTKRKRTYDSSYAWFVKKDTIPEIS